MDALERCHAVLADILGEDEPLEVLRRADEHRDYWRPRDVRIVLLAESHVYTTADELGYRLQPQPALPPDLPSGFVRLVYCLGYGENGLLDRPITGARNTGTPQYWKVFFSCVHPVTSGTDFAPFLVSRSSSDARVPYKLRVLQQLRDRGIWLLDASIAALYRPGRPKPSAHVIRAALQKSWDLYIQDRVLEASPSAIVCVGRGVLSCLRERLDDLGIQVYGECQPNARCSSAEHLAAFKRYYCYCNREGGTPDQPLSNQGMHPTAQKPGGG
jgi:hypothetical protein